MGYPGAGMMCAFLAPSFSLPHNFGLSAPSAPPAFSKNPQAASPRTPEAPEGQTRPGQGPGCPPNFQRGTWGPLSPWPRLV